MSLQLRPVYIPDSTGGGTGFIPEPQPQPVQQPIPLPQLPPVPPGYKPPQDFPPYTDNTGNQTQTGTQTQSESNPNILLYVGLGLIAFLLLSGE